MKILMEVESGLMESEQQGRRFIFGETALTVSRLAKSHREQPSSARSTTFPLTWLGIHLNTPTNIRIISRKRPINIKPRDYTP